MFDSVKGYKRFIYILLNLILMVGMIFPAGATVNAQDITITETVETPVVPEAEIPTEAVTPTETDIPTETPIPTETDIPAETAVPTETETLPPGQYSLLVEIAGSGLVTLDPAGGLYDPGTQVTLQAVPAEGWEFTGWSGSAGGTANPGLLPMDGDKTIIATFTESASPPVPPAVAAITTISELTTFNSQPGVPSEYQTYTVSGSSLTADILINAPTGFEVSLDGLTFSPSLSLSQIDGVVNPVTVAVRMVSSDPGPQSGLISHTSVGATQADVAVTGEVEELRMAALAATISFTAEELLGRPTDTSITVNIVPDSTIEYHYQYGTSSGDYTGATANFTATGGQPHEIVIGGLSANTKYFYRMQYHAPGDAMDDWINRSEHTFWTQRAKGSSFSFSVTSDIHNNRNTNLSNAMTNIINEQADFEIDLGDTFLVDGTTSQSAVNNKYLAFREPLYFDKIGNSIPIFLSPGNHEEEEGWNLDDTFSIAQADIQARKLYYPTPIQDSFYSGNTNILGAINATTYGDQLREDYYAWTWGDALFVVIDPFEYTMNLPYAPGSAGEGSDDPQNGNQWSWTLGAQQYQWFKQTLENSDAKFKFVFSHQMLGGIPNLTISGVGPGYVRGGAGASAYFEWGGKNSDGSEGFAANRNLGDFGSVPIHQLMVANGVSAYFHGHDHQYVYEKTDDGVVYQEVPSPAMSGSGFSGIYSEGDHSTYTTIKMLPSMGHLLITVNPSQATVDYISSSSTSGTSNYAYTIEPAGPSHTLTMVVDPEGSGTTDPAVGDHSYSEGSTVNVTAAQESGYVFDHWSGACADSGSCSVTMDADKSVTAHFVAAPTFGLSTTVNISGAGTINPAEGIHTYNQGDIIPVTAVASPGYSFSNWSGDCTGSGACSVTMDSDKSVTANFAANSQGTVTLDGPVTNATGAANASSVSFSHTTGAGSNRMILVGASWNSNSTARTISSVTFTYGSTVLNMSQKIVQQTTQSANRYSAIWYSPTEPPQNTTGTVAVTFSGTVTNGIVVGAANFAGVNQATPFTTSGGANNGSANTSTQTLTLSELVGNELVFDTVFIGGSTPLDPTVDPSQSRLWTNTVSNTRGVASTEQAAGSSVTMSWTTSAAVLWATTAVAIKPAPTATTFNLTTAVDPSGGGTINPAAGVHPYSEGAGVDITATANPGYTFTNWSGDCTGSGACHLTMDAVKSVTAHFSKNEYTLTITSAHGTVAKVPNQSTYYYGDSVQLTANPASGYIFNNWSGDFTGTDNPATISINGNNSVTANYLDINGIVYKDGSISKKAEDADASTITLSHTTGTGSNRLLLVGLAYNNNAVARTINSVTFTYGSTILNLSQKIAQQTTSSTGRYAAIWYSPTEPPLNTAGTITVTFNGTVTNGIVVGAANFAGVNQATPFTASGGINNGSSTTSTQSITLNSLNGNELLFDTVFVGGNPPEEPTIGAGQTQQWTDTVSNTRGVASTEQATGNSATMSWTTSSATVWASVAVAINPVSTGPACYTLSLSHTGQGSDPTASPTKSDACASAGQYVAGQGITLSGAVPAANWLISGWTGTSNNSSTSATNTLTMPANNQAASVTYSTAEITFTGSELLGRPTDTSISVSVVPNSNISLYFQYSQTSGGPYADTAIVTATAGEPKVVVINGLSANTKYYYRMQYSINGGTNWVVRPEHSFYTKRAAGSTYSFTITSDSHINIMLGDLTTWTNTLNDIKTDGADFEIDLGDAIAMDNGSTSVSVGDISAAEQKYKDALPYFNIISGSSPIFLVAGNHEQQEAWHLLNPVANSLPIMGKNAEKKFFLNPVPGTFYTGNLATNSNLSGDHLLQDYYAWTWGDALFVVISPFWHTTTKPYTTTVGGGETDTTGSGDRWDWSLGQDQFNWLKTTLEGSSAKYKFVFAHQIVGGNSLSNPDQVNYGHGGVDSANLVEWGGYNVGGTTWAWDTRRSGWGSQPIHQMMVDNGVKAFFHGHDHQYAYEKLDGIVYQSVPSAGFTNGFNIYTTGGNGGKTIQALSSPGHLKVTVGPSQTSVNYFETSETTSAYTYSILAEEPTYKLTTAVNPAGGGTTTPAVGENSYATGTLVDVTATPAVGFTFDHWSGNCTGSGTCQVTMDGDKTVTAHFTQNEYTLTVNLVGSGTVNRSIPGPYHYGDSVTLTAVGSTNYYRLEGWSGDLIGSTNPADVTINGNKTITATFEHSTFYDVPFDHPLYNYVQKLYDEEYTSGCQAEGEPLEFCPEATMIRAESAVFMLRALSGTSYVPPTVWDTFGDTVWTTDPNIQWGRKWAEGMFDDGLTAGCQYPADSLPKLFCPYDLFTREQGAVFGLRIKYGKDFTPGPASGNVFDDMTDTSYWATKWMEKAYADDLLLRCDTDGGKPSICPSANLNRSWAAYMIVLAKDLMTP